MWDMLNQKVLSHAKSIYFEEGHRDQLYTQLDAERNVLIQQRFCVSGELYDCEQQQLHAEWADLSMDRSQDVLNSCTLVRSGLPPPPAEQLPAASSSNVLGTDSFSLAQHFFP